MINKILYAIIALLLIGVVYVGFTQMSPAASPTGSTYVPVATTGSDLPAPAAPQDTPTSGASATVSATTASGLTLVLVAQHNSAASCYTVVSGSVYDVTAWINRHPGGPQAIEGMCGKDATEAFVRQHGSQRKAEAALASFKIGVLAQ